MDYVPHIKILLYVLRVRHWKKEPYFNIWDLELRVDVVIYMFCSQHYYSMF